MDYEKVKISNIARERCGLDEMTRHQDHELIVKKILICRSATIEKFGSVNVFVAAENLYKALYFPQDLESVISPNKKYPDRMNILGKRLSLEPDKIPDKEEFVMKIRRAMTREPDFRECFSESSRNQFYNMMEMSELTIIWTDGDTEGIPEYKAPGSKEQLFKIGSVKFFNQMRRQIAQKRGVKPKEVLSIMALEGKERLIPEILKKFEEKKIEIIIVLEDRVKNLKSFMDLARKNGNFSLLPVLVGIGDTSGQFTGDFYSIDDIAKLADFLTNKMKFIRGKKIGTVFDLDGVLFSDDIRRKIQSEAVINVLQREGWI